MSNSADAVQAVTDALATYLTTQITGLTVFKEWPAANQKLVYPTLTIFTGDQPFTPLGPYEIARTTPAVDNTVIQTLVVGEYDLKMQLDLWCSDKVMRAKYLGLIVDALSPDIQPLGLRIQLASYYNEWAQYDVDGHQNVDDEAAAQRQERRAKIRVLVNVKAIRQKTGFAMINLETDLSTPDNIT